MSDALVASQRLRELAASGKSLKRKDLLALADHVEASESVAEELRRWRQRFESQAARVRSLEQDNAVLREAVFRRGKAVCPQTPTR